MSARVQQELALLRRHWPDLAYQEDGHWVRLRPYPVPPGWTHEVVDVCFRIPAEAATAPYGFYVSPALLIQAGATTATPSNYTPNTTTPFGEGWAMFSWAPLAWQPKEDVAAGDNMLHFVRSFRDRLEEAT
jgi:hypothetical protein